MYFLIFRSINIFIYANLSTIKHSYIFLNMIDINYQYSYNYAQILILRGIMELLKHYIDHIIIGILGIMSFLYFGILLSVLFFIHELI